MKNFLLKLIRFYRRAISPNTPPSCRFTPTCSEYAEIAITRFGAKKGLCLTCKRLCRCHPFYKGDPFDPVPMPTKEDNQ